MMQGMPGKPAMSQPGAPEGAPAGGPPQEGGGGDGQEFGKLITGVGKGLGVVKQVLAKAGGVPPEALQELEGIEKAYQGFVAKLMGESSGGPPEGAPPQGPVSVDGGMRGVPVR